MTIGETHMACTVTAEQMETLWRAIAASPERPQYIAISHRQYKALTRFYRSKRKGKSRFVEITETQRVDLDIPVGATQPVNRWWGCDRNLVDKRRLKRHKRIARNGR